MQGVVSPSCSIFSLSSSTIFRSLWVSSLLILTSCGCSGIAWVWIFCFICSRRFSLSSLSFSWSISIGSISSSASSFKLYSTICCLVFFVEYLFIIGIWIGSGSISLFLCFVSFMVDELLLLLLLFFLLCLCFLFLLYDLLRECLCLDFSCFSGLG